VDVDAALVSVGGDLESRGFDHVAIRLPRPNTPTARPQTQLTTTSYAARRQTQTRRRNRRRVEAQVKVESATVAQATGQTPQTEIGEFETNVVQALMGFFGILLVEGLVLAGSVSAVCMCPCRAVGRGGQWGAALRQGRLRGP